MLNDYKNILVLLIFSISLALIILLASYLLVIQKGDIEKLSPYECGFSPFQDARQEFDVKFYLVAILFIIFDLEISFLFPWAITVESYYAYWTMLIFLGILTIGFIYEWKKGALNW